jgi:diacylglycerol kinase family enzyme
LANKIKTEVKQTGLRLYLTALFRIVRRDYYCHKVRIRIGEGDWQEKEILLAAVNNGKIYGGGFKITPKAEVDDGLLEICVIDALPRWQLFLRLPFAIAGRHAWMKPAHFYRTASFTLESDIALPAALDGELISETSYQAKILPGALSIISGE